VEYSLTKAVEKVDLKIPNNRIEKVIFSFDIVNVILGLITVFTVMIFPFIYWGGQMGVVPTIIGFVLLMLFFPFFNTLENSRFLNLN